MGSAAGSPAPEKKYFLHRFSLYTYLLYVDRKTARATIILLPLLGLTYVLFITHPPSDVTLCDLISRLRDSWKFAEYPPSEAESISRSVFVYFNVSLQSTQV